MRRTYRPAAALAAALLAATSLLGALFIVVAPNAAAQDVGGIVNELERSGYYIEPGGEGSDARFQDLVRQGERAIDNWYFVSMADTVPEDFADDLFDRVSPRGNVLVYFIDGDGFVNVQLASAQSESIETRALAPFDDDWNQPEDFMADVITEFDAQIAGSSTTSSGTATGGTSTSADSDGGGGFPWLLVGIPVLLVGGLWFMNRRGKQKKSDDELKTAEKIRAELQKELDELANDVLVLSGPVDLCDKPQAVEYYREATDTYLTISDEMPDGEKLETANLSKLAEIGTRVAHARWQMDAAEALIDGEPVPEKPKIPPPPPPKNPTPRAEQRRQLPQRQPRPRVPYSRSRSRNSGGLLDILIAGAGMMGSRRSGGMFGGSSGGGMFGAGSRSSGSRQSTPRRGGGVFGSSSRAPSSSRSSSRSTSRSSSRRSGNRRSTSRRRRRGSSGRPS